MPKTSEHVSFSERMIFWRLRRGLSRKVYTRFRVEAPTPGGRADADEVIVSKFGVFVVKLVRMRGMITGGADDPAWLHRHFGRSMPFANPLPQAHHTARGLAEFLALPPDALHILVIFAGGKCSGNMPANVFGGTGFVEYIRSFYVDMLSPSEVERINAELGGLKKRPAPAPAPLPASAPLPAPAPPSNTRKSKPAPVPAPLPKAPVLKTPASKPPRPEPPVPPASPVLAAEKKLRDDLRATLAMAPPVRPRPAVRAPHLAMERKGAGLAWKVASVALFLLFGAGLGLLALSFLIDIPRVAPELLSRPAFRMSIPALAQPPETPPHPSVSSSLQPTATLQPPTLALQPPVVPPEPPPPLALQPPRPISSPLQPPDAPLQMPDDLDTRPAVPLRLDTTFLEPARPTPTPGITVSIPDDEPAAPGKVRAFRATVDGQDVRDADRPLSEAGN